MPTKDCCLVDMPGPSGGGKFKQYVKEIINAERQPIRLLEQRKAKQAEKLKLVQDFVGRVRKLPETFRELENVRKFRDVKADWPAKELMDVVVDKDAAEVGEYQIEIVQLAGRHSMISDGFSSVDDSIGTGYFTYTTSAGESRSKWISGGDTTLKGLVRALNNEPDINVQASLINDGSGSDTPWRIVVQGKKSGSDEDIEYPDFYFLDGDFRFSIDEERSAQNAIVKFNGFEIESASNKFELLPGVTVDLMQAKEGYEFTLNLTEDAAKISAKVKALVDAINSVLDFVYQQNKIDASSDTSKTLAGDTSLFTIESRLRRLVFQEFQVDPNNEEDLMRISDVGIQFEKTGQLTFKEDRLKKLMVSDFPRVAQLFAGENGFIQQIKYLTDGFLTPGFGPVSIRENGVKDRMRSIDRDIATKERNLERRETQLKRQFAQLENLMNSMQGQQSYLQQSLGGQSLIG